MRLQPKNQKLSIPLEIISYACQNRKIKALEIFLYLKMYSDGKIHFQSAIFNQLKADLGIKDNRTLDKHLSVLKQLNWINYSRKSGNFFISGFNSVRKAHNFIKRDACTFQLKDFHSFNSFLTGAVIAKKVNTLHYFKNFNKGGKWAATNRRDVAFKPKSSLNLIIPEYDGLSNSLIAKLLGCKKTRASVLKQQAHKDGYIQATKKFVDVLVMDKKDSFIRDSLYQEYQDMQGKLVFKTKKINGSYKIVLAMQLWDEIKPVVQLKRIGSFKKQKSRF